jgi:hypothetical protein
MWISQMQFLCLMLEVIYDSPYTEYSILVAVPTPRSPEPATRVTDFAFSSTRHPSNHLTTQHTKSIQSQRLSGTT